MPSDHLLPERVPGVLAVVYVIFTAGQTSTGAAAGTHVRDDLCDEAVHLTRLLARLMPDEPEVLGLLALLLLSDARRATRVDGAGDLVLLADQDRWRWDRVAIDEGAVLVDRGLRQRTAGPYLVQAAIAACHATAATWVDTDWVEIAALYGVLDDLTPTPAVALNRAVAVLEAHGPQACLDVFAAIAHRPGVAEWHLFHASQAESLRRQGSTAEAAAAYRRALACGPNPAERRFLERRLLDLQPPT